MRRSAISTLIFVLIIAGGVIVYVQKNSPKTREAPPQSGASPGAPVSPTAETASGAQTPAPSAASQLSEPQALEQTVRTVVESARPEKSADQLIQILASSGQEPVVAKDKNPYTGEMTVIRTKNPLPGTRYFHAQFFSDEKGGSYPQHISVEFRAGPNAFSDVVGALHKSAPELGEPSVVKQGFMQWEMKDGYVAWIKELGPQDLEEDGINPHTAADAGTIWLAVEISPHDEGEAH